MQVSDQIDHLVVSQKKLKPLLSENDNPKTDNFANLVKKSLETSSDNDENSKEINETKDNGITSEAPRAAYAIPDWVDADYSFDPENPRKPNMRELMEAISGKRLEDLYKEPAENWKSIVSTASELLDGVIGSNEDTRDWSKIIESKDILAMAQSETGKMYEPKVDIVSNFNKNGDIISQIAVLKDKNENILRQLPTNIKLLDTTLKNFGATRETIPENLEEKVVAEKLDKNLLSFLQNFKETPEKFELVALQTATENLSRKLSEEIPLDELEKL